MAFSVMALFFVDVSTEMHFVEFCEAIIGFQYASAYISSIMPNSNGNRGQGVPDIVCVSIYRNTWKARRLTLH